MACSIGRNFPASGDSPGGFEAAGRVLDVRSGESVSPDALMRRATAARYVVLGEVHDNAVQHRLQSEILQSMVQAGRSPALAMEQFDLDNQPALDAARLSGERDPERLADAGRLDRKGWRWPEYKPLVELAAANNLSLLAANLSREDARTIMKSGRPGPGVAPATPAQRKALEQDIIDGHCGIRPSTELLTGMVEAQRARDARMAEVLERAGESGMVLIAGAGHARRDRGVPSYLPPALRENLLSIAFVEVPSDGASPPTQNYAGIYDLVWFTPRAPRDDPCKDLHLPLK